jgi:hypothetical protein
MAYSKDIDIVNPPHCLPTFTGSLSVVARAKGQATALTGHLS